MTPEARFVERRKKMMITPQPTEIHESYARWWSWNAHKVAHEQTASGEHAEECDDLPEPAVIPHRDSDEKYAKTVHDVGGDIGSGLTHWIDF